MNNITTTELAGYIDHTLLRADADDHAFDQLCEEAIKWKFHTACTNSCRIPYIVEKLQGTDIKVCSTLGFPLGQMDSSAKAFEAEKCVTSGAVELDMVINVGFLKSGDSKYVENDIHTVRKAIPSSIILKVIIETSLLTDDEKVTACKISEAAGANFVKTCSGYAGGGASPEDIKLMRETVSPGTGVKASGGIKTREDAIRLIEAGANRIGASASVAIVSGSE